MYVESILTYIQEVSKMADKSVNTPAGKYWRVMLNQCFDVLDKVCFILKIWYLNSLHFKPLKYVVSYEIYSYAQSTK